MDKLCICRARLCEIWQRQQKLLAVRSGDHDHVLAGTLEHVGRAPPVPHPTLFTRPAVRAVATLQTPPTHVWHAPGAPQSPSEAHDFPQLRRVAVTSSACREPSLAACRMPSLQQEHSCVPFLNQAWQQPGGRYGQHGA